MSTTSTVDELPLRVFQVATSNVGGGMVRRIQRQPDLDLVGVHCYSADKVGRDVGELVGMGPLGIRATRTVQETFDAGPDCGTFHGVFPDVDLYVQVLEAGINVVTTADWVTGDHRNANHPHRSGMTAGQVIQTACEKGNATFYGTGMNPGLAQIPKGSLGGCYLKYVGLVRGTPLIDTHLEWPMMPKTEPSWSIEACYITQIDGDPCTCSKHMIFPKPGADFSTPESFATGGMTVTGMPALNAIRTVVAASPGLVTSADMPLRSFVGRFAEDPV